MASKNLSGIINVFIIAIVSVSLLIAVAGSINKQTDYQNVENETVDISSVRINGNHINESVELQVEKYPGATNVGDEVLKNFVLYNDTTQSVAATETTDYVVNDSTGILTLKNTSYWTDTSTNTSSADYDYAHDNYIGDATSRIIIGLIILFAAIGIFLAVAGPSLKGLMKMTGR